MVLVDRHRVAVVGHRGERGLLVGTRGVATGRRRVFGRGHRSVGHDHHLPGGVVGCSNAGCRLVLNCSVGRLELNTVVGLAVEVAGVGVAAVAAEIRQDVGTHGHGLRLELLKAPVLSLGACPTQRGPARGRLAGNGVGHVVLERQRVDRPRLSEGVVERGEGSVHCRAAGFGDAELQQSTIERRRRRRRLVEEHRSPRTGTPSTGVDFPGRPGLVEAHRGRAGHAGCGHPRRRVHNDVEPGVLFHGDVDVHAVGQRVGLGGVAQRQDGWSGARNGGSRRHRGGDGQGGGHQKQKAEKRGGREHHAAPRDIGWGEHDPTSVEASPGRIGASRGNWG